MSSIAPEVSVEGLVEVTTDGPRQFSRLEKMLFFALISECERCIRSEGYDCFDTAKKVRCPFFEIRQEYGVRDIFEWKEMML